MFEPNCEARASYIFFKYLVSSDITECGLSVYIIDALAIWHVRFKLHCFNSLKLL